MIPSRSIEKTLPTLIKELDTVFSKFIRLRDSVNGKVVCFICGIQMTMNEAQCGHWMKRDNYSTRFNEDNCHALCPDCNSMDNYHPEHYQRAMERKYTQEQINNIRGMSMNLQKFMRYELVELIEYYKSEVRRLHK